MHESATPTRGCSTVGLLEGHWPDAFSRGHHPQKARSSRWELAYRTGRVAWSLMLRLRGAGQGWYPGRWDEFSRRICFLGLEELKLPGKASVVAPLGPASAYAAQLPPAARHPLTGRAAAQRFRPAGLLAQATLPLPQMRAWLQFKLRSPLRPPTTSSDFPIPLRNKPSRTPKHVEAPRNSTNGAEKAPKHLAWNLDGPEKANLAFVQS